MSEPTPSGAAAPTELAGLAGAAATLDQAAAPPPVASAAAPGGAAEPSLSTADVIQMAVGPWFLILAPNWKVTATEQQQLAVAYGALLDKYFPDWTTRFGVELQCVVVSAAVLGPRIAMKLPPKLEEKKSDDKPKADAPAAS